MPGARDEGALDDLVAYAAELCDTPIAVVSVVEETWQVFLARFGTDLSGTPRAQSFCAHAMHGQEVMEVRDATLDPRFAENTLVIGPPHIRFYAGAPLISHEGVPVGAISVVGDAPRTGLTAFQRRGLTILATAVMARLEARRAAIDREQAADEARRALAAVEIRFQTLADTMPQMVWSTQPDGHRDYSNARWYEFTGSTQNSAEIDREDDLIHPSDRDRVMALWRESLNTGDPLQTEHRLRHADGTYRWVLCRALPVRDGAGQITRWFGTCTDIHEQKLAFEEREIISQELSHRIKNIFAVIGGLIQLAARNRPEIAATAAELRERIAALGRAHDFVRPHSENSRPTRQQDSLQGLLEELLAPYQSNPGDRVQVTGQDIRIDDRAATPLALLFHELATNASKYGALSNVDGRVAFDIAVSDGIVRMIWTETGGPALAGDAKITGFGTHLIELSAVRQLGGRVVRDWKESGLVVTIEAPLGAFSRSPGT